MTHRNCKATLIFFMSNRLPACRQPDLTMVFMERVALSTTTWPPVFVPAMPLASCVPLRYPGPGAYSNPPKLQISTVRASALAAG